MSDRTLGDEAHYPNENLQAAMREGGWVFTRKDGTSISVIENNLTFPR